MYRYFKRIAGVGDGNYIYFLNSKGLSDEYITGPVTTGNSLTPKLCYFGSKTRVEFNGSCLKQDKIAFNHGTIIDIRIVYEINKNCKIRSYPRLENCLFRAVSLTKTAEIDKYKYSGHCIGFDRKGKFSVGNGFGRNCMIFGVGISIYVHVDNKKKDTLIFGEVPTQGLDDGSLITEKKYSINFTEITIKNSV